MTIYHELPEKGVVSMCVAINKAVEIDESLLPKKPEERKLNPWNYMSMWLGDGVNLGNMTLGGV